jgi:hypothetical protein
MFLNPLDSTHRVLAIGPRRTPKNLTGERVPPVKAGVLSKVE